MSWSISGLFDRAAQAALSQIGREEKAAAADEVSPIVRHRASIAQLKVMGFAEPVIGPATSGGTRWLNPSYGLRSTHPTGCFHFRLSKKNVISHCGALPGARSQWHHLGPGSPHKRSFHQTSKLAYQGERLCPKHLHRPRVRPQQPKAPQSVPSATTYRKRNLPNCADA